MTTKIPRSMLAQNVLREYPVVHLPAATGSYPLYLNAPTDGTITNAYFQIDADTNVVFNLDLDGTPVSWTTAAGTSLTATTTAGEDTAASANTFSAGDALVVDISSVDGTSGPPTVLTLQLVIEIPAEDA